mgnify:CR=1 FL=1
MRSPWRPPHGPFLPPPLQRWNTPAVRRGAALAFLLVWVTAGSLVVGAKILQHGLNSDSLYLTCVYQDVFVEDNPFLGWTLSPSPCFFPDMAVYFSLLTLMGTTVGGLALYPLVFSCLLLGLMALIGYQLTGRAWRATALSALAMVAWLGLVVDAQSYLLDEFLYVAGRHAGALLTGLGLLALCLSMQRRLSAFQALGFGLLSYLGLVSDILLLPQFVLPILIATFITDVLGKRQLRLFLLLGLLSAAAWLAARWTTGALNALAPFDLIPPVPATATGSYADLAHQAGVFMRDMGIFLEKKPLFILLWVLWAMAAGWQLINGMAWNKRPAPDSPHHQPLNWLVWVSIISVVGSLAAPLYRNAWMSVGEVRYIIPVFLLPFLIVTWLIMTHWNRLSALKRRALTALLLILPLLNLAPAAMQLRSEDFTLPYPAYVRFIDETAAELGLQRGYCDYWFQNTLKVLSRGDYEVNALHPVLWPYFWINNHYGYVEQTPDGLRFPAAQFIIADRLDRQRMREQFGEPAKVRTHQSLQTRFGLNQAEIWVYNRDSDLAFRNFMRFFFLDREYPSQPYQPQAPHALTFRNHHGDRPTAEHVIALQPGQPLDIVYDPPARGDMLEASLAPGARYRLTFFGNANGNSLNAPLAELTIAANHNEALQVYYVRLPDEAVGKEIRQARAASPSPNAAIGHLWIYKDARGQSMN